MNLADVDQRFTSGLVSNDEVRFVPIAAARN